MRLATGFSVEQQGTLEVSIPKMGTRDLEESGGPNRLSVRIENFAWVPALII